MIVDYSTNDQRYGIHVWDRTPDGIRTYKRVTKFEPYFYMPENKSINENDQRIVRILKGYKTLMGDPVKKIVVNSPFDIYSLRKEIELTHESNIAFPRRYLIDVEKNIPDVKQKKLYFDIETEDDEGMPSHTLPIKKIMSIAFSNNFDNQYEVYILKNNKISNSEIKNKVAFGETEKEFNIKITTFETEAKLIEAFLYITNQINPDYILGWNSHGRTDERNVFRPGFDIPYLLARCKQIGLPAYKLSPINEIEIQPSWEVHIKGRECPELMTMYKLLKLKVMDMSLDSVAERELGAKKKEVNGIINTWNNNPIELALYNATDIILTKMIDEKLGLSDQMYQMSRLSYSQAEDIGRETVLVRHLCVKKCNEWGVVLPTLPRDYQDGKSNFTGGFVGEVMPGVHEFVASIDVESMYPNIIRAFCISPETFSETDGIQLPNGLRFIQKTPALLPSVVDSLYEERIKYKRWAENEKDEELKKLYESKSASFKSLLNSVYGAAVRLFGIKIGESITLTAQDIIKFAGETIKSEGLEIVYTDTDGHGFKTAAKTVDEAVKIGTRVNNMINNSMENYMEKYGLTNNIYKNDKQDRHIKIKFEKIYSRGFWAITKSGKGAKKRRFGWIVWKDGKPILPKVEIMGFEVKKSGFSQMYKDIQKHVLEEICPKEGIGATKESVDEYIHIELNKMRKHEVPTNYLAGDVNIGEIPKESFETEGDQTNANPKRRGILYGLKFFGLQPQAGKRYKQLWVSAIPKGYPKVIEMDVQTYSNKIPTIKRVVYPVDVIVYEHNKLPDGFEPNYEKYIELNILKSIEGIYASLKWEMPKIKIKDNAVNLITLQNMKLEDFW